MTDYVGFMVELESNQLGHIVGIVKTYNENQIGLTQATINGVATTVKQYTIDKRFISGIKIVNTPPSVPTKETSGQTPKLQQSGSSRDLRRDKLRNIPGACTAYVCDQSPPRIVKTPKSQRTAGKQDKNYSMNTSTDSVRHEGAYRNRSKSAGEGGSGEYYSACESDPSRHQQNQKPWIHSNNTNGNSRRHKNHHHLGGGGGNRRYQGSASAWDSLRIEDFIDQDFDFEANNALFDKQAFYQMSDAVAAGRKKGSSSRLADMFHEGEQILVEGPNGIGFVPAPPRDTASTPTPLNPKPKPSSPAAAALQTPPPCAAFPSAAAPFWTTQTANRPRVPVLARDVHQRLLHFLATGQDCERSVAPHPLGLGWDRIIERAGQAIVNAAVDFTRRSDSRVRQATNKSQTPHQHQSLNQTPMRVLVLPGAASLPGALAINTARQLAERGAACVLLHPPSTSGPEATTVGEVAKQSTDETDTRGGGSSAYRVELTLAQAYAPKLPLFEDELGGGGGDEEEEDGTDDNESELFSQAGRMWISRLPGLKIVNRVCGVTSRPKNAHIDMLVLGQPLNQYEPQITQWLCSHTAIGLTIQLDTPSDSGDGCDGLTLPQSSRTWLVQLGLPVITLTLCPLHVDIKLIDVGMSRSLISTVTGDLRILPPPGLFDSTSCVQLVKSNSTL